MLDKCPVISDDMAYRVIDGEAILVSARSGKIISLNPVGSSIWQFIDGKANVSEIVSRVYEEFEVADEQASADVIEFLQQLLDRGVIRLTDN